MWFFRGLKGEIESVIHRTIEVCRAINRETNNHILMLSLDREIFIYLLDAQLCRYHTQTGFKVKVKILVLPTMYLLIIAIGIKSQTSTFSWGLSISSIFLHLIKAFRKSTHQCPFWEVFNKGNIPWLLFSNRNFCLIIDTHDRSFSTFRTLPCLPNDNQKNLMKKPQINYCHVCLQDYIT